MGGRKGIAINGSDGGLVGGDGLGLTPGLGETPGLGLGLGDGLGEAGGKIMILELIIN